MAAGGSYYYAKQDLKGRKLDPAVRQGRTQSSNGKMTCESLSTLTPSLVSDSCPCRSEVKDADACSVGEDRLNEMSQNSSNNNQQHDKTLNGSGGPERSATRMESDDIQMNSKPTGVDTSTSGPGSRSER